MMLETEGTPKERPMNRILPTISFQRIARPALLRSLILFGGLLFFQNCYAFQGSSQRATNAQPSNQNATSPQLQPAIEQQSSGSEGASTAEQRSPLQQLLSPREVNRPPAPISSNVDPQTLPDRVTVPLQEAVLPERSVVSRVGENNITLIIRNGSLPAVLSAIAEEMNRNIVAAADVTGQISVTMTNVPLERALDAILSVNGYRWTQQERIILVSSISGQAVLSPLVQGREVRVFHLNYVSATDLDKTVKGLLSPVGKSYVTEVSPLDKRRTREELVVEDLPDYLDRIQSYIHQADKPPPQVLIEAHVLQVDLRDDNRHGVNLQNIASLTGGDITLTANGFADRTASPAFIINVDGRRLDAVVELIKQTTDAKTLASPKVLAVNGQEARIQIGQSLGYLTTTTTQTSTLQQVNFLDLGIVLTVTPIISNDGQILMTVKPEVSSGQINTTTNLPDSNTTEVESTVLMPSGHAMVVGGLISDNDNDQQSKVPFVGDIPGLGKLFQRRTRVKSRREIIIALLPRIVPYNDIAQHQHAAEVQRATTPLTYGPLIPTDRTSLEARLPSANHVCEPLGKPMEKFPTPPVAYSPHHSTTGAHVPYLPPKTNSLVPMLTPSSYLPTVDERPVDELPPDAEPVPLNPQTSGIGQRLRSALPRVARQKVSSADGWQASRQRR